MKYQSFIRSYRNLNDKEALEARLNGTLPIIDIIGHPFFADTRLEVIRPKDNFSTLGIDVNKMDYDPDTKRLSFYYHKPSMTQYQFPDDLKEMPKDVVMVNIPNIYLLDPIGAARGEGLDELYYYRQGTPVRMYCKAKIIPLAKTPLAAYLKGRLGLKEQKNRMRKKRTNIFRK